MTQGEAQVATVIGPTGQHLGLDDLPPVGMVRWVARRKAELVAAVRGGLISLEDACQRYELSEDEYRSWERLITRHGMRGLRSTRIQKYRAAAT